MVFASAMAGFVSLRLVRMKYRLRLKCHMVMRQVVVVQVRRMPSFNQCADFLIRELKTFGVHADAQVEPIHVTLLDLKLHRSLDRAFHDGA